MNGGFVWNGFFTKLVKNWPHKTITFVASKTRPTLRFWKIIHAKLFYEFAQNLHRKGAWTNHMDRILGNFDPPPPYVDNFTKQLLLSVVVIWANSLPLVCPRGLYTSPYWNQIYIEIAGKTVLFCLHFSWVKICNFLCNHSFLAPFLKEMDFKRH